MKDWMYPIILCLPQRCWYILTKKSWSIFEEKWSSKVIVEGQPRMPLFFANASGRSCKRHFGRLWFFFSRHTWLIASLTTPLRVFKNELCHDILHPTYFEILHPADQILAGLPFPNSSKPTSSTIMTSLTTMVGLGYDRSHLLLVCGNQRDWLCIFRPFVTKHPPGCFPNQVTAMLRIIPTRFGGIEKDGAIDYCRFIEVQGSETRTQCNKSETEPRRLNWRIWSIVDKAGPPSSGLFHIFWTTCDENFINWMQSRKYDDTAPSQVSCFVHEKFSETICKCPLNTERYQFSLLRAV